MAFMKIPVFLMMVSMAFLDMSLVTSGHRSADHKKTHHHICSEPVDLQDQLEALYSSHVWGQLHDSFYMTPFLREAAANETHRHNFNMEHLNRSALFSGSAECPREGADFLRGGDPCPVYHTINSDPTRYPRVLLEAQCRCKRCQDIAEYVRKNSKGQSVRPSCEGVYYYIQVLRRLPHCVDHVYRYAPAWEKLQIGCSCHLIPRVSV